MPLQKLVLLVYLLSEALGHAVQLLHCFRRRKAFPFPVREAALGVLAHQGIAMSEPHEIDYTLNFDSTTAKEAEKTAK